MVNELVVIVIVYGLDRIVVVKWNVLIFDIGGSVFEDGIFDV